MASLGSAPGLTANDLRRMVCTHATVYEPVSRPAIVSLPCTIYPVRCRMHALARGMEPLTIDRTHILVLNYNGRGLLAECLPSIVEAAQRSPVPCAVTVVDNGSTDGSRELVATHWPTVGYVSRAQSWAGLVQPGARAARRAGRFAVEQRHQARRQTRSGRCCGVFETMTTPSSRRRCCWTFDGQTYEGMRTRVRSRFGLVQGMCRVPGFEEVIDRAGPHGRGRAGAGRRSPQVPGARGL